MNSWKASLYSISLSVGVSFCYVLTWIFSQWTDSLSLDLSNLFGFYRFLTFSFVTDEVLVLILTVLGILMYDKLTRDAWGYMEMCIFYIAVNISSVILSLICCYFFAVIIDPTFVFTKFNGCSAFICGVLMISRQFDADRVVIGYKTFGVKSQHGLWLGFLLYGVCAVIGLLRTSSLLLYAWGFISSWIYLRFFQRHPFGKFGDHRASFSFARLFPAPLEPYVAIPTNLVYRILLRTRLCPSLERQSEIISASSFALNIPGLADSEPDRHRRIALKALNERLLMSKTKFTTSTNSVAWPSLDEKDTIVETSTTDLSHATDSMDPPSTSRSYSVPAQHSDTVLVDVSQPLSEVPTSHPTKEMDPGTQK